MLDLRLGAPIGNTGREPSHKADVRIRPAERSDRGCPRHAALAVLIHPHETAGLKSGPSQKLSAPGANGATFPGNSSYDKPNVGQGSIRESLTIFVDRKDHNGDDKASTMILAPDRAKVDSTPLTALESRFNTTLALNRCSARRPTPRENSISSIIRFQETATPVWINHRLGRSLCPALRRFCWYDSAVHPTVPSSSSLYN